MDIQIVRGTTDSFNIILTGPNNSSYVLQSGEKLIFGVKKDYNQTSYDIKKVLTSSNYSDGKYILTLRPSDTIGLSAGIYLYDIGLQSNTDYFPVVTCSHFEILKNITSAEE